MATFVDVIWTQSNDILVSIDRIKASDSTLDHLEDVYQNGLFSDYYLINDAQKKIMDYIENSQKHNFYKAKVFESFLPEIIVPSRVDAFLETEKES